MHERTEQVREGVAIVMQSIEEAAHGEREGDKRTDGVCRGKDGHRKTKTLPTVL